MSRAELDLVDQAADASGLNFQDTLYGAPSNTRTSSVGPRASTPAGQRLNQCFDHLQFDHFLHLLTFPT